MDEEVERVYMDLLVEIGRAGTKRRISLVWGNQKSRFMTIRENDYRDDLIGTEAYQLVGVYTGEDEYPRFAQIYGDIYAFVQQETQKAYGCRPELEKFAQASQQSALSVG